MATKKKKEDPVKLLSEDEVEILLDNYDKDLKEDPELSLEVDPTNKYNFTEEQKRFIHYYCEFKSILTAAEMAKIDMDQAKDYFISFSTQQEIRRINRAMYHRQFRAKLISLDDIGGYLCSILMDEVPYADRLSTAEKLKVIPLLLQVKQLKAMSVEDPSIIANHNIEAVLRKSSIDVIQKLLNEVNSNNPSNPPLTMGSSTLTAEEKEYLNTLPTNELLELINISSNPSPSVNTTKRNELNTTETKVNTTINTTVNTTKKKVNTTKKGGDKNE